MRFANRGQSEERENQTKGEGTMFELVIVLAVFIIVVPTMVRGLSPFGAICLYIVIASGSVFLMSRNGINFRQNTDKTKLGYQILAGFAAGIVYAVFLTIVFSLFYKVNIFPPLDLGIGTVLKYALVFCASSASEELFFRNYVYYKMNRSIKNEILTAILVSLIFAVPHYVVNITRFPITALLTNVLNAFIFSLFLIFLRSRINTFTVWSMIVAHCVVSLYTQLGMLVDIGSA